MKTNTAFLAILFSLIFIVSACKKDEKKDDEEEISTLAEVRTDSVVNIKQYEATFKGRVIKEGGAAVGIRGFCWSESPNPTVEDDFSQNTFGAGEFSHKATGLKRNTTYYVRTYATNGYGTVYGNELSFKTVNEYQIGETGPGGGLVFYLDGSGGGMEAAPVSTEHTAIWGCYGDFVTGTSGAIGEGKSSTKEILNGCAEPNIAAEWCDKLTYNGYSDWFLPSMQELELMYSNLKAKGKGNFNNSKYWSSSQFTEANAFYLDMSNGSDAYGPKSDKYLVRAARNF
jgi:hypothetical protein